MIQTPAGKTEPARKILVPQARAMVLAIWEITRFNYDLSGNLTNLVDDKGQNTYWKYDMLSR